MKKFLAFLMIIVTLLTFSISAYAAEVGFVPSITNKGAPEFAVVIDETGKEAIGYLYDSEGNVIAVEYKDHIVITSVAEADTSTEIPDDAKTELKNVFQDLSAPNAKLSEICPDLNDLVAKKLGTDKTADDLVIRDLFDLTALCDPLKTELPKDGTTVDLNFKVNVGSDDFITAMVYVDGAWKLVPTTNNGDGTITCSFEEICPVAFLVPAEQGSSGIIADTPTGENATIVTGNNTTTIALWSGVMVVSLGLIITLCIVARRKKG